MTLGSAYERIKSLPETAVDAAMGVVLTAFVWLQIAGFGRMWPLDIAGGGRRPEGDGLFQPPPEFLERGFQPDYGVWPYVVAALVFLPLAFRRKWPVPVLVVVSGATLYYLLQTWPPTFVVFGAMIALATVASRSSRGRTVLYVVLLAALIVVGSALVYSDYSSARWVAQAVGVVALLVASALFGDAMRSRREYVEAVEQRLKEAERTREEEALRRVDEERIRIAREVHDIVAHGLSVVTVQAQAGLSTIESDPAQSRSSLETIRDTSKEALAELRSMLEVLRTGEGDAPRAPGATLDQLGDLVDTVRESGTEIDVALTGDVGSLPDFISLSAFRIVREALTNVMRHSQATSARVVVGVTTTDLLLEVTDDGQGTATENDGGHGIQGMRERASALGGSLAAGPIEGGGFRVSATIPLPRRTR